MPTIVKQKPKGVKKPSKSVIDRIGPMAFEDGIKLNIYGRSGTGKTTFWATFPKPILAIICSGGKKPGELRSINTPEYRKAIKQVVIESPGEVAELAEHQAATGAFKTVVLDHASGLQDLVLKSILGLEDVPVQRSWGMAKQQDWGQVALQVKELLRGLLDLSCNVVIVAQERDFNTEGSADGLLMPFVASALTPSVVGWLNPACDYIVQTHIRQKMEVKRVKVGSKTKETKRPIKGEVEYCLRVAPDPVYTTKFRVPKGVAYPESIVNPTYDDLIKLINGA